MGNRNSLEENNYSRFIRKCHATPSGCWDWLASKDIKGYGCFNLKQEDNSFHSIRAHRASWLFYRGTIPDELQVLHSCDNPSCVNPDHLFLGTNLDNVKDKVSKGRQGAILTPDKVIAARKMHAAGSSLYEVAAKFNCSYHTASRICSQANSWNSVHNGVPSVRRIKGGERNGNAKLTDAQVLEIRIRSAA